MKNWSVLGLLVTVAAAGQAQELGRVISSTPVVQQVGVPQRICTNEAVMAPGHKSGAGAIMGALAGGAMGNAVGQGGGRAAATMLGLMGGAIVGDRIEGQGQVQNVQQCSTQTSYENRTVGYNVVYEYAGKQYSVQMPNDPGPSVQLQVTPVGAVTAAPASYARTTYVQPSVVAAMEAQPIYTTIAPAVVYPAYYARPYYAPVGVSLNFGYSSGWHGGRHWR